VFVRPKLTATQLPPAFVVLNMPPPAVPAYTVLELAGSQWPKHEHWLSSDRSY
jgi:hypothetical protein